MSETTTTDLLSLDTNELANAPYNLAGHDNQNLRPKYVVSSDLMKSVVIDDKWRAPVMTGLSGRDLTKVEEAPVSFFASAGDIAERWLPGVKSAVAETAMFLNQGSVRGAEALKAQNPGREKEIDDLLNTLNGREYPLEKWAQRLISEAADNAQVIELNRAIYNREHGIDPEAWSNQTLAAFGSVLPGLVVASTTGGYGALPFLFGQFTGDYSLGTTQEYIERTGDVGFENFTAEDTRALSAGLYGSINTALAGVLGLEGLVAAGFAQAGLKGALKKLVPAFGLKAGITEAGTELIDPLSEQFVRTIDNTSTKTWGEAFEEAITGAVFGFLTGGALGSGAYFVNRANLRKSIKVNFPGMKESQVNKLADTILDLSGELALKDKKLYKSLREKVAATLEGADIENADATIDSITSLEYAMIVSDAAEKGIKLEDHPLFKGDVNELGWFREGIPEHRRAEIDALVNTIRDLQKQLKDLNASETKNWEEIGEVEQRLEAARQNALAKVSDLLVADKAEIKRMLNEQRQIMYRRQMLRELRQQKTGIKQTPARQRAILRKAIGALNQKRKEDSVLGSSSFDPDSEARSLPKGSRLTYAHGGKNFRINFDGSQYGLQLVNADGQVLADIGVGKNGVVSSIERVSTAPKGSASILLQEAERIFGRLRAKPSPTKEARDFWHRNKYRVEENGYMVKSSESTVQKQSRVSGKGKDDYRGAYLPEYRLIVATKNMDASTLAHELAHDWFLENYRYARSGKASKDFMRSWGALEQALGLDPKNPKSFERASEAFSRAYESWIMGKQDWSANFNIEDKDKDQLITQFKRYQRSLREIYDTVHNPYFIDAWGADAKLKPEIESWFERVAKIDNLEAKEARGEISHEEAVQARVDETIDNIIETAEPETKKALTAAKLANDTKRYEVKGGNKNSLQRRLSSLAKDIDQDGVMANENYNTHRDMMAVAEAADNFVKNRQQEAIDIINGVKPETDGLYASDLYTALERVAIEMGDLDLLNELRSSKVANILAKELGQRVAGFRNYKQAGVDFVQTVKALDRKYAEAAGKEKGKAQIAEATALLKEAQAEQDARDTKTLDSLLDMLKCK